MLVATFDIGTTAVKAVVVRDDGCAVFSDSIGIRTIEQENFREQRPDDWYGAFIRISGRIFETVPAEEIKGIIFSGQMQDVIPVGETGEALRNAILYSDGRAQKQAERILLAAGDVSRTGNHFDGSMPLAKILWLKEKEPDIYEKTKAFLISSKDYIIGKLTGNFIGDMTACSTAGAMDLEKKVWDEELIGAAGLDAGKFPKLLYSHELAGTVTEAAASETGYPAGTKVYAGTGDAGATTLASGILSGGEFNINLGTSSWVAAVSDGYMECKGGGFNLAAMQPGKYINVVPFFNGGNVHKFLGTVFSKTGEKEKGPDYETVSGLLRAGIPGSNGVYFLPYLAGERFPVMDEEIRGCYLGLSQETTAADMAQSALEGVAYSIRQGLEVFGQEVKKLTLIGGGAREAAWCRILSNVTGKPIYVYKNPDILPSLAIAAAAFLSEGLISGYEEFIGNLEAQGHCILVEPDTELAAGYDVSYEKYKRIYPLVREFYKTGK